MDGSEGGGNTGGGKKKSERFTGREKYRKEVRTQTDLGEMGERVKKRLRNEGKQTDNWAMASAPQPAVSPTICLLSHAERGSEAQGEAQSKNDKTTQDNLPSATLGINTNME